MSEDEIDQSRAPLLDHLVELRRRLVWSVGALGAAFVLCIAFAHPILAFLVHPLKRAGQGRLIYTDPLEGFVVDLKVAFFAALMIAFPIIANQIWKFVAPGLYAREKRAFLPFLYLTPVLFLSGASLAYFVAMPLALRYLMSFQGDVGGVHQEALPAIGSYLTFVMKFMFGFGIAFLLPVLLMLIEQAGLVTRKQLVRGRRFAIVAVFAAAAVLSPPDLLSMLLLAVPLVALYEFSLLAILIAERRRKRDAALTA